MTKPRRTRRPNGSRENPVRSVRVSDETWDKAKRRADYDGVTISHVVAMIIEGYAQGLVDLPRVQVVYSPAAAKPALPEAEPVAEEASA